MVSQYQVGFQHLRHRLHEFQFAVNENTYF